MVIISHLLYNMICLGGGGGINDIGKGSTVKYYVSPLYMKCEGGWGGGGGTRVLLYSFVDVCGNQSPQRGNNVFNECVVTGGQEGISQEIDRAQLNFAFPHACSCSRTVHKTNYQLL